jgi:molecular chaperone HscB
MMLMFFLVGFFRKREYNIKDNNLEGKYKDWQKKLHPDLVHSKSEVSVHLAFIEMPIFNVNLSKSLLNGLYFFYLEREGLCCGAVSTCD